MFVKQTDLVVQYLSVARLHEHSTRLEIPKIKHAPTSLTQALEEYLNDKDFEVNRRQYLAEREAKKSGGKSTNGTSKLPFDSKPAATSTTSPTQTSAPSKAPEVTLPLIDFFDSIQDNQQTMAQPQMQQYPQQTGFQQTNMQMPQPTGNFQQQQQQPFGQQDVQSTNPFAQMQQGMQQMNLQPQQSPPQQQQQPQLQTQFTGAGFGGYTPQPFSPQNNLPTIPQNGMQNFPQQPTIAEPLQAQPTSTNPFRASMLPPSQPTGLAEPKLLNNPTGVSSPLGRSPTNPFAKHSTGGFQSSLSPTYEGAVSPPFSVPSIQSPQQTSPFAPQQPQQPLQPTPTGTNPFARGVSPVQGTPSPQGGLTVHATGSTKYVTHSHTPTNKKLDFPISQLPPQSHTDHTAQSLPPIRLRKPSHRARVAKHRPRHSRRHEPRRRAHDQRIPSPRPAATAATKLHGLGTRRAKQLPLQRRRKRLAV